jgi:hypothetical protein
MGMWDDEAGAVCVQSRTHRLSAELEALTR